MKKLIILSLIFITPFFSLFSQLKITDHSSNSLHLGYGSGAANFYLGNYVSPTNPEPQNQRGHFAIEADNQTGNFFIYKPWPSPYANIRYYFFIHQYGNIGIGTTNPSYKLDVSGTMRSAGYYTLSDERLKTNIQSLTNEKNKIYSLNAKSYIKTLPEIKETTLKSASMEEAYDEVGKKEINDDFFEYGFLAQEVRKVFPELVSEDNEGLLSINYIGLIPIIIEALKEEHNKNEILELKVKELEILVMGKLAEGEKMVQNIISSPEEIISQLESENNPYLEQNIPNPFNQSTQINYYLPQNVQLAYLCIYDLQGKQLEQIKLSQRGKGFETFQGSQFSAGMYIYALIVDGKEIDTKRMILTE